MKTFEDHWALFLTRNPGISFTLLDKKFASMGFTWGELVEREKSLDELKARIMSAQPPASKRLS